jgi:hypothetical protein
MQRAGHGRVLLAAILLLAAGGPGLWLHQVAAHGGGGADATGHTHAACSTQVCHSAVGHPTDHPADEPVNDPDDDRSACATCVVLSGLRVWTDPLTSQQGWSTPSHPVDAAIVDIATACHALDLSSPRAPPAGCA